MSDQRLLARAVRAVDPGFSPEKLSELVNQSFLPSFCAQPTLRRRTEAVTSAMRRLPDQEALSGSLFRALLGGGWLPLVSLCRPILIALYCAGWPRQWPGTHLPFA